MSRLTFEYEYSDQFVAGRDDPEEAGRLTVSVVTGRFSGTGTFEASPDSIRSFGESLSIFPIRSGEPLAATWGYSGSMARVVISAPNTTGTLVASVEIEAHLTEPRNQRRDAMSGGVRTAFVTDYVQIDAFRRAIANLMDRKVGEAILREH